MQQQGGGGGAYIPGLPVYNHSYAAKPKPKPKARPPVYNKSYAAPSRAPGPPHYNKSYAAPKPKPRRAVAPRVSVPRAPSRPRVPSVPRNRGAVSSTSVRSGKAVGSNSSGRIAKTAAPTTPKPLTPEQWLAGDSVYKAQRDALAGSLTDYQTRQNKETADYKVVNAANRKSLLGQQSQSKQDLMNDYGARGMLGGAEQTALTNFGTDWTKRLGDFDTAYANYGTDAAQSLQDYKTANRNQLTKAQQDAAARRAAKYGL